jgi:hypothetical protein
MRRPASLCYALARTVAPLYERRLLPEEQPAVIDRRYTIMDAKNKLYFGDNLKILRDYVEDASVDLIYLDPPFNSSATYNVLFKEKSGEESAAQIMAFEDFGVAPLYERRLLPEEEPAVIDRRYSRQVRGRVQGNRRARAAQARRPDASPARVPGPQRHDGVSRDDGDSPGRASPRAESFVRPHDGRLTAD